MVKTSKISVIIPVYNVEKYLDECLTSVINQTLKDIEIICIDDGSTDNSAAIVEKYTAQDGRIKLIRHEKNKGLSAARNTGLEHAAGDFIYFLDSDDYIEPDLFECAVNVFENFDIDFFCFSSKPIVEGGVIQNIEGMNNYIKVKRDGVFALNFDIMQNTNIHVWNKIYKAEKIREHKLHFVEGLLYEDIFFTWAYNFLSKKAYFEPEVLHNYRVRSTSIMEKCTQDKRYEMTVDHMKNWHELFKFLSKDSEMFLSRYDDLVKLLWNYRMRSKEICPLLEKYKIEKLYFEYLDEITKLHEEIEAERLKQEQERENTHKVINLCGIRIKIRRKKWQKYR